MKGDEHDPFYDAGSVSDQREQIRYHRTLSNTADFLAELAEWEAELDSAEAELDSADTARSACIGCEERHPGHSPQRPGISSKIYPVLGIRISMSFVLRPWPFAVRLHLSIGLGQPTATGDH